MTEESPEDRRERLRRNQKAYRERLRSAGRQTVQLHLKPEDLAAIDDFKSRRGFKSRTAALTAIVREHVNDVKRSEATS